MKFLISSVILLNAIYSGTSLFTSTYVKKVANGTCGISTGSVLVQQLSETLSYTGGLFWADDGEKIAYVDRYYPAYGKYTPSDGKFNHMSITDGKESICIFPVKNATGLKFVIGLDRRLIFSALVTTASGYDSNITNLMTVSNNTNESFMKGKIDAQGRLWYSSSGGWFGNKGKLYKIENLGTPVVMAQNLHMGGGMAWTNDNKYFYLVDSGKGLIYKYDFDITNGTIDNRRIIFTMSNHTEITGKPFDIVLDTTGNLWIGLLHGSAIIQYNETSGEILWTIPIPASDIVSLEFGGLDKKTLYVGTAKHFLHNSATQPGAGALMAVSGLGVTGIPDNDIVIPDKYYK